MIRKLIPEDAAQFTRLRLESFKMAPLSFAKEGDVILDPIVVLEQIKETEDQFILGYFDDEGKLKGMMGFNRYTPNKRKHRSYLWGVYLNESCRGKGLAQSMLQTVIEDARKLAGLERIILTVSHRAEGALRLYAKLGFVVFGREPGAARNGDEPMDEIYMMLDL